MKYPTAFPTPDIGGHAGSDGMTLRDYFAAAALQGLIAHSENLLSANTGPFATWAYEYANEMLEARKWENPAQRKGPTQ